MPRTLLIAVLLSFSVCWIEPLSQRGAFSSDADDPLLRPSYLPEFLAATHVLPRDEIRALWVVRDALRSPEAIDRMIDFAQSARFQLLFVQVRGRGDAYYRSNLEPPGADLETPPERFDPLSYVIERARESGISVHAWINTLYVWSDHEPPPDRHVTRAHPGWLMSDRNGVRMDERSTRTWQQRGIEGYYLSPAVREVRAYTAAIVDDIVSKYAVDGVHLDYVRYPGFAYGWGAVARTRFTLEWGVDPIDLQENGDYHAEILGQRAVAVLDSILIEWRAAQVDSVVLAVREAAGAVAVSAAVVPDPIVAKRDKGQDWVKWVHERYVDFVVPMAYNYYPEELEAQLPYLYRFVGRDRILVGLALHDGRNDYLEESVRRARTARPVGFSLFSYNVLAETRFARSLVERAFFSQLETDSTLTDDYLDAPPGDDAD